MNRKEDTSSEKKYPPEIKWTKQRKDVSQILMSVEQPLSAGEIYNRLLQDGKAGYAVSTVYRILGAFEEKGMVQKSTLLGADTALYSWNRGEHLHYAICLCCHKKIPLQTCPMQHMQISGEEFTVTGHRVEIYGYCKNCGCQDAKKTPTPELVRLQNRCLDAPSGTRTLDK